MKPLLLMLLASLPALACGDDTSPLIETGGSSSSSSTSSSGSSSGGTTETDESSGSGSESSSSTTGPMPCVSDEECTDAEAPFCGTTGECGTCDGAKDPDGACAELDPAAPVCVGDACVQCTVAAPEACMGKTPVCDDATNTCIACTTHDQCGEAACNLYTGACLPADAVVHVGGATPDFPTLTLAVASFGPGDEGTILVHEGMPDYNESVTVDGGRVLAFLAAADAAAPPGWVRTAGGAPQLAVTMGSTVLIDGLRMSGNADDVALMVDSGRVWLDRSRIVQNSGGGIVAENGAELTLRNCFAGQGDSNTDTIVVTGAVASIRYTTVVAGDGGLGQSRAVLCDGEADVVIRDSLIVAVDDVPELECSVADVSYSATETATPGTGNATLGDLQSGWLVNETNDFHLGATPPIAIATTAQWEIGDPPTDIDGEQRPMLEGTPDYAGADVP
jgi:hypothetical protein